MILFLDGDNVCFSLLRIISALGKRNFRITDDNNSSAWKPPE
jgi:hypothetical protein